jgi:hypothetical protein
LIKRHHNAMSYNISLSNLLISRSFLIICLSRSSSVTCNLTILHLSYSPYYRIYRSSLHMPKSPKTSFDIFSTIGATLTHTLSLSLSPPLSCCHFKSYSSGLTTHTSNKTFSSLLCLLAILFSCWFNFIAQHLVSYNITILANARINLPFSLSGIFISHKTLHTLLHFNHSA